VLTYNVGNGVKRIVENRRKFNDGKYHYVRITRTGDGAILRVDDDLEMQGAAGGEYR
jgi:Laminin G domain